MSSQAGTLFGIGVGPGDPDLITMKAAKILTKVDIVFAAASTKNHHSLAVNIARPHIPESTRVKMLRFPMTKDQTKTKKAWQAHSETICCLFESVPQC
jgi:precorrin-2/cobalt-factor-2 C20-methyltransferase